MTAFLPPGVPKKPREAVTKLVTALKSELTNQVCLLGIRGYYHEDHNDNERGLYDDAIFVLSPNAFLAVNANVDPSVKRQGIATLQEGTWLYKVGMHGLSKPPEQRYLALVQAGPVTVSRDGEKAETGYFGINIHRGGYRGTSSLGCQTIYPGQWEVFFALVAREMQRAGQKTIHYILTK